MIMAQKITLHEIKPEEFKNLLQGIVGEEFNRINTELQRAMGEDDLVSTGTACRILGICSKSLKVLTDQRKFSVYHHLKEKRYNRGELLEYREQYRINKKRG